MQQMSFDDFKAFYIKNGRCINDACARKNKMNEAQLKQRYKKYLDSSQKKQAAFERYRKKSSQKVVKIDKRWQETKKAIDKKKGRKCWLIFRLSENELRELRKHGGMLVEQVDRAHIFRKSNYPHLKYNVDIIVPLNRWSHSCLDQYRHPITGVPISNEEHLYWWRRIVPEFDQLVHKYNIRL